MSTFNTTMRPTSFGFFDADSAFQLDADNLITFVLRKLGEDVLSVELTKKMIWACFEESTLMFNAYMIEYQAKSNLMNLLGNSTGSIDPTTGKYTLNLVNTYTQPNLEWLVRQAEPYAAEVGYGQSADTYSGSIALTSGQQDYDLYTDLQDAAGNPLVNYMISGSTGLQGKMRVVEVFHQAPSQYVFNSNLASNFVASGMPVESYVPDTRFYVMPLFEDILRASMLETASRVRRSHYSYRISGRKIRLFPTPSNLIPAFNDKLWIRVAFPMSAAPGLIGTFFSGSEPAGSLVGPAGGQSYATSNTVLFGASNPANVPFGLITYSSINPWARSWIFQMTLAQCKELLGLVRNKFKNFPIPGAELTLNGDDLISQAREDKTNLTTGEAGIIPKLESLTYGNLAEQQATLAESNQKMLQMLPFPPTWLIKMGGWIMVPFISLLFQQFMA